MLKLNELNRCPLLYHSTALLLSSAIFPYLGHCIYNKMHSNSLIADGWRLDFRVWLLFLAFWCVCSCFKIVLAHFGSTSGTAETCEIAIILCATIQHSYLFIGCAIVFLLLLFLLYIRSRTATNSKLMWRIKNKNKTEEEEATARHAIDSFHYGD